MGAPYPLLEIDVENPPADFAAETPCPMLGVDPTTKALTPRVQYLLTRIDGMTPLGELLDAIPMAPKALLEGLLLLYFEGLIGFAAEFELKYLQPRPPTRFTPATGVPRFTPSAGTAPLELPAAPTGDAAPVPATSLAGTPPRVTPAAPLSRGSVVPAVPVVPVQISRTTPTVPPEEARTVRPAAFSIPPPPSTPPPPPDAAKGPPPTEELTRERNGDLAVRPLARLARHLLAARYTGVLTLRRGKVTKRLLFAQGEPCNADSDGSAEELGPLMHARGKIDDKVWADYQRLRREGAEPLAALMQLGAVAGPDAARADRWRAQAVLYDALLWRDGSFELGEPNRFPAEAARYDLGLPTLVLKAWREAPFDEQRKKFFDEHRNWYLVPGTFTEDTLGKMRLNPKEERLLEAIREQTRRVRDVFEITSLFITETYRFMDGLLAMGLVELSEKNPTETGPLEMKDLRALFEAMKAGNFFDRLSAHPVSTDQDIEDARQRMLARVDPRHYSNLRPETRQRLEQMKAMVEEAYEHLREGLRRKEYRNKQYNRPRLEYFAEIQYRKGEIFLSWRDDPKAALEILGSAWEMCPDIPLYAASYALALVRVFPADRARRAEAKSLIDRALGRGNPQPRVLVLAGAAARELGDDGRAEQLFAAAIKASGNAPDIAHLVEQMRKRQETKKK